MIKLVTIKKYLYFSIIKFKEISFILKIKCLLWYNLNDYDRIKISTWNETKLNIGYKTVNVITSVRVIS